MSRSIEVTVSPAGEIKVEAMGFTGSGCQKVTEALEEALGYRESRVYKAEFFQKNEVRPQQKLSS
jgi:hypothetical protein